MAMHAHELHCSAPQTSSLVIQPVATNAASTCVGRKSLAVAANSIVAFVEKRPYIDGPGWFSEDAYPISGTVTSPSGPVTDFFYLLATRLDLVHGSKHLAAYSSWPSTFCTFDHVRALNLA